MLFAVLISFIPGFVGMIFSPIQSGTDVWYMSLNNSVLTPAGWVFSVAWTILYLLLGIALYFIITKDKRKVNKKSAAYGLFITQMVLNAFWSYVFFGLHMTGLAFIAVIVLLGVAVWMASAFWRVSKTATYLVIPYILWLVFAAYLNGVIVLLN